jgi:hypothetical protein
MNSGDLKKQLDELSSAKLTLLEKRLLEAGIKSSALHKIPRRTDREFAPLSFTERRLWFLNQLEPKSPAYNEARIPHLTGPLDSKVSKRWFNALIDRHETRRTTFATAAGSTIAIRDLRSLLQRKLPDYMVPAAFVFLDSLPLTPNGRLDRKAFPAPDQSRPELDDTFTPPHTPVEELPANIWAEVLKLDKVGIHDNFFQLGGHSLLATQVVPRVRDAVKFDLPLRTLFEAPTIHRPVQQLQDLRDKQDVTQTAQTAPIAREQYRAQNSSDQD